MATPDYTLATFDNPRVTVEVAGDFVHLTLVSRFGEPIMLWRMSADDADAVAVKLCDAVGVIDTRNSPTPEQIAEEAITAIDQGTGQLWRNTRPNPTFSEAVDALFDGLAPRLAASA